MKRKAAFISGPFTNARKKGSFDIKTKSVIQAIIDIVRNNNIECHSSHLREEWGKRAIEPKELLEYDFEKIENSEFLIVYISEVPSYGTMVELGYALNFKKKILVIKEKGYNFNSEFLLSLEEEKYFESIIWDDERNMSSRISGFLKRG